MEEILSKCGYRCDLCPAYDPNISELTDKQKISDGWFQYFGFRIFPEDIGCVGCLNEGKHADVDCPVRPCVIEKGIEHCACCENFGCEKLKSRMDFAEEKLKNFPDISEKEHTLFFKPYLSKHRLYNLRKQDQKNKS